MTITIDFWPVLYALAIIGGMAACAIGGALATGLGIAEGKPAWLLLVVAGVAAIFWSGAEIARGVLRWIDVLNRL